METKENRSACGSPVVVAMNLQCGTTQTGTCDLNLHSEANHCACENELPIHDCEMERGEALAETQ